MKFTLRKIEQDLNKAYLKQVVSRGQMETFKTNLKIMFSRIDEKESEENLKNIISDFLKDTYYKNQYEVNTKGRSDLVIHNGKSAKDTVAVIIEAKKPSNKAEMISAVRPNAKALHELLHYYMQERYINDNKEIKHLIATNIFEWYIFDAADFERFFFDNRPLRKSYEDWRNGVLVGANTDWFYDQVARPFIEKELDELYCTYFNFTDFRVIIENADKTDDDKLINLYKVLSPEHLLKKPFANDSNTLNREFYNELLHIIGLEERPEKGKKLIYRKKEENREEGSLIENTLNVLKVRGNLERLEKPEQYGENEEEQLYSVALELCITWLNRILFLKLLEGQLIKYNNGDQAYAFINSKTILDFDELAELFFEVLAVIPGERSHAVNEKFGNIPYLNSSLFEMSDLEKKTIQITAIKDRLQLSIYHFTVLKDRAGKRIAGKKHSLQYLFEFLEAYDFTSESNATIQEENKTIINAAVLGLIFEKINGYKDGSFFTPGFITMYMSRETIRLAVVQKFKDLENKEIETFEDAKAYCARFFKQEDLLRFNRHINSLKICDPAVGSGHFLVSALNEILAIKSELNILVENSGYPLDCIVSVDNDELTVISKRTNEPFEYHLAMDGNPPVYLQKVQETLFHEKQTIIENCLFGVDINPKSVLICRLRLWIELLKNAYYKSATHELETLPNIDINIKCGNSLISRFDLDADISKALKKSNWTIDSYRIAVMSYRNARTKEEKRELEHLIESIKKDFTAEVAAKDKRVLRLKKLNGELITLTTQTAMFEKTKTEKVEWEKQVNKLTGEISKLETEIEEIKNSKIYQNAFEWRFEFPEVLNDDGDFVGFDVVIGNPPYGVKFENNEKEFFRYTFQDVHVRTPESYNYFVKQFSVISSKTALCCLIIPSSFLNQAEFEKTRQIILANYSPFLILNLGDAVFEDVAAPTCIIGFDIQNTYKTIKYEDLSAFERKILPDEIQEVKNSIEVVKLKNNQSHSFIYRPYTTILDKCYNGIPTLKDVAEEVATGVSSGLDKAYVFLPKEIEEKKLESHLLKPLVVGGEIHRFFINPISGTKLIYITDENDIEGYPNIKSEISKYNISDSF